MCCTELNCESNAFRFVSSLFTTFNETQIFSSLSVFYVDFNWFDFNIAFAFDSESSLTIIVFFLCFVCSSFVWANELNQTNRKRDRRPYTQYDNSTTSSRLKWSSWNSIVVETMHIVCDMVRRLYIYVPLHWQRWAIGCSAAAVVIS